MENKNKIIFTACHGLTKAIVAGTNFNYNATFTACLKCYHTDFNHFVVACATNNVDVVAISNNHFCHADLIACINKMDVNLEAEKQVKKSIDFAFVYGMRKRAADIAKYQLYNKNRDENTYFDSVSPLIIDSLRENEKDDIKQDIFLFLYKRKDNPDFCALPDVIKLCHAGEMTVNNHYKKLFKSSYIKLKDNDGKNVYINKTQSIDGLKDAGIDIPCNDSSFSNLESIINVFENNTPKKHRMYVKDAIMLKYANTGNKQLNNSEVAEKIGISERTLNTVYQEMKKGLCINDFRSLLN